MAILWRDGIGTVFRSFLRLGTVFEQSGTDGILRNPSGHTEKCVRDYEYVRGFLYK